MKKQKKKEAGEERKMRAKEEGGEANLFPHLLFKSALLACVFNCSLLSLSLSL